MLCVWSLLLLTMVQSLYIGNGSNLSIHSTSTGILPFLSSSLFLKNILHIPSITYNLLSVYQLALHKNCSLLFDSKEVTILENKTKKVLFSSPSRHGMYLLTSTTYLTSSSNSTAQLIFKTFVDVWHWRLRHPNKSTLYYILSTCNLPALNTTLSNCIDCLVNKSHKFLFSMSLSKSDASLDLVYSDIWG